MSELPQLNDDNFETEVLQSDLPALVDFWAPWCGPCRIVGPVVEELAKQFAGQVKVAKMNVDENQKTPTKYNIRGIPTLILFKGGQVVDQIVGAVPRAKLVSMIESNL
jgi:thioredoxin 1